MTCGVPHPDIPEMACELDNDGHGSHSADRVEDIETPVPSDRPLLDPATGEQAVDFDGVPLFELDSEFHSGTVTYGWVSQGIVPEPAVDEAEALAT